MTIQTLRIASFVLCLCVLTLAACDAPTSSMVEDEPAAPPRSTASASKAEPYTERTTWTYAYTGFFHCANDGLGEEVAVNGASSVVFHYVQDGNGGFHATAHEQLKFEGTGLTSGKSYRGRGTWNETFSLKAGATGHRTSTLQVKAPGPGNDFKVHVLYHVTITPDGKLTAEKDTFRGECS